MRKRHRVGRSLLKRKRTTAQLTQDFRAAKTALEQRVGRQHVMRIQTEDDYQEPTPPALRSRSSPAPARRARE